MLCQRSARGAAVSLNREFIRICNHVSSAESTAASRIGIAYTAITGLVIYRSFPWRRLYPMLVETASLSGAILFIIGAALDRVPANAADPEGHRRRLLWEIDVILTGLTTVDQAG